MKIAFQLRRTVINLKLIFVQCSQTSFNECVQSYLTSLCSISHSQWFLIITMLCYKTWLLEHKRIGLDKSDIITKSPIRAITVEHWKSFKTDLFISVLWLNTYFLPTNFEDNLITCCEEGLNGTEDQHDDHHDGKDRDGVAGHVPRKRFHLVLNGKRNLMFKCEP